MVSGCSQSVAIASLGTSLHLEKNKNYATEILQVSEVTGAIFDDTSSVLNNSPEEQYNRAHTWSRVIVEQTFRILKSCFR